MNCPQYRCKILGLCNKILKCLTCQSSHSLLNVSVKIYISQCISLSCTQIHALHPKALTFGKTSHKAYSQNMTNNNCTFYRHSAIISRRRPIKRNSWDSTWLLSLLTFWWLLVNVWCRWNVSNEPFLIK